MVVDIKEFPAAKKSLGQHWLNDEVTLKYICQSANLTNSDIILEIGPGHGSLTKYLINVADKVIAVELDNNLASELRKTIPAVNLTIVNQDILSFDFSTLPKNYKVLGNIPYYLTSNLIRVLASSLNKPSVIVIMVQKEVAQRVAAKPGAMSLLSISAQLYFNVELGRIVPANLFLPPPKVDSQIIILTPKNDLITDNPEQLLRLVRIGFSSRRKTLLNSLSSGLRKDKFSVGKTIKDSGINPDIRPQELAMHEWLQLLKSSAQNKLL